MEPFKSPSENPYLNMVRAAWHYAGDRRPKMVLFYSMFIIANAAFITQPYVIGSLINAIQAGGPDILSNVTFWLCVYVSLTVIFWLLHGPARVIERRVAFDVRRNFILQFYDMLTHLPIRWHNDHHSGNTVNRINKAAMGLWAFADFQMPYVQYSIRLTGVFIALSFLSIWVALFAMTMAAVIFTILTLFDAKLIRKIHEADEKEHVYASAFFDYITNIHSVVSFNLDRLSHNEISNKYEATRPPHYQVISLNEYKWGTMSILIVLVEFCVLFGYILWHIQTGTEIMVGTLVAIYQYLMQMNQVFVGFAIFYGQLIHQNTNFRAVQAIQDDFSDIGVSDDGEAFLRLEHGAISFKDVSFQYRKDSNNIVFDGLNLDVAAGQKIGLVGHSGAGKSTLVSLLMRFHDTDSGQIMIDGQDTTSVNQRSLRDNIALIPQDTSLFEDDLMSNIRYGRIEASDEEVIEAARQASADLFIRDLEDGYQTMVGERGVKLSGGQRQRIAIARAILKDAPILVLDEATSALDSESEKLIQDSLKELMEGKTVIAIAHRLSTLVAMDRIIVMDQGKIIEDGSHDELLTQNGLYAKLWAMQSGGFLKVE